MTLKVAGKQGQNDTIVYANTTSVTLDREWKRYEIDLAGADLHDVTHPFGFEVHSGQAFYLKGVVYY